MSAKKKNKNSAKEMALSPANGREDDAPSECTLKVLFHGKKGEILNRRKGMVNSADLKRLSLRQGATILLRSSTGERILCDLWTSPQALSGNITLSRFWTPSLSTKQVLVIKEPR
jgi:hypothetical protein